MMGPMTTTAWQKEYELGIPEIDFQHRKYVTTVGELEQAIAAGRSAEFLDSLFSEIGAYMTIHFATEERYFDRFGCYPEAQQHRHAHRKFAEGIAKLQADFTADPARLSAEVASILRQWLLDHIILMDKGYVSCFKANGL